MWKRYAVLIILLIVGVLVSRLRATGDHHLDDGVAYLLQNLRTARTELALAADMQAPARRGEALGVADGALRSALTIADSLGKDLEPKGYKLSDPYLTIRTQTNQLLHYTRQLTPDMTGAELQRRVELLTGLETAIAGSLGGKWDGVTALPVNRSKLVDGWHDYLLSLDPDREMRQYASTNLKIADPPTPAQLNATVSGADLTVNITWDRTYTVFPDLWKQTLLIYSPQPLSLVSWQSTAPNQDGLGRAGALQPVEPVADAKALLDAFRGQLPTAWTDPTHLVAVSVLEGLPQTVTLRLSGLTDGTEVIYFQHRGFQYAETKRIR
jgi:hypothetical protein